MKTLLLTTLLFFSHTAIGDWHSAAHFGFANEDRSSTGFKDTAGSMSFLDVGYAVSPKLNLGMRNLMQGGQKTEISYYRMGSGPMALYQINSDWIVHGSWTFFSETALSDSGEKAYRSRGRSLMFGWERIKPVSKNLEVVYGGFLIQHEGEIDLTTALSPQMRQKLGQVDRNQGLSHGVEIALRMFF